MTSDEAAKHLRRLAKAMRASGIAHATIDGVTIALDLSYVRKPKAEPKRDAPVGDEPDVLYAAVEGY
jgi:hypothetical protein